MLYAAKHHAKGVAVATLIARVVFQSTNADFSLDLCDPVLIPCQMVWQESSEAEASPEDSGPRT